MSDLRPKLDYDDLDKIATTIIEFFDKECVKSKIRTETRGMFYKIKYFIQEAKAGNELFLDMTYIANKFLGPFARDLTYLSDVVKPASHLQEWIFSAIELLDYMNVSKNKDMNTIINRLSFKRDTSSKLSRKDDSGVKILKKLVDLGRKVNDSTIFAEIEAGSTSQKLDIYETKYLNTSFNDLTKIDPDYVDFTVYNPDSAMDDYTPRGVYVDDSDGEDGFVKEFDTLM